MEDTTCQRDFCELNALVVDFLCAYQRLKSSERSLDASALTLRECADTTHAIAPRVTCRNRCWPNSSALRQPLDDVEAEAVRQLDFASPPVSQHRSPGTKPSVVSMPQRGSVASISQRRSFASSLLPYDISSMDSIRESLKHEGSMTRHLDNLLRERAFKQRHSEAGKIQLISNRVQRISKNMWEWYRESPGEEVMIKAVEPVMCMFIVLNCILIGISLDTAEWSGWSIIDYIFALIYVIEMSLRLKLIGWREMYLGFAWRWSVFDTVIVVLAVVDLFIQASDFVIMFRILRLVRLSRLLRVLRLQWLQELVLLVRGMASGTRCLMWCMFFVTLPILFTGLLLSQILKDWGEDGLFSSVPSSLLTTFRCMCGDCTDNQGRPIFSLVAQSRGWHFGLLYAIFILVTNIGLFNLITALFIEVTMEATKSDTVLQCQQRQFADQKIAKHIKKLTFRLWIEHDNRRAGRPSHAFTASIFSKEFAKFSMSDALGLQIDQSEYHDLVHLPHIREVLDDMGYSSDDIFNLFDMLDVDRSGSVDLKKLVKGLHRLRGEAKKFDLVALSYMIDHVQDGIDELQGLLARFCEAQGLPLR